MAKRLIFFDTEFTELTQRASLLSLGIIADSGEKFYAEFTDFNIDDINDWVKQNVLTHFSLEKTDISKPGFIQIKDNTQNITKSLKKWLSNFGSDKDLLQFWGDVPHWDWVLFCELFGGSLHLPQNIHYMCMDLATLFELKKNKSDYDRTQFLRENNITMDGTLHNALYDTQICKTCYYQLIKM